MRAKRRGLRIVARAHIAVKAMPRAPIPVNLDFGVRGMHLLHLLGWNMRIELAEMQLHRNLWRLRGIFTDVAGIVADSRIGMKPRRTEPRQQPAQAVANHTRFFPSLFAHVGKRSIHIDECLIEVDLLHQLPSFLRVCAFVHKIDALFHAIKERRSRHEESIFRISVGNRANMPIHSEDLLNYHQSGNRFTLRPCYI